MKTAQTNSLRYFFIGTPLRASASGIPVSSKRRAVAVALQTPPAAVSPDLPERLILLLLSLELFLLLFNLRLLFLDGIDQDDADAVVLDALDLAVSVKNEFRCHLLDLFSAEAEITSRMPGQMVGDE